MYKGFYKYGQAIQRPNKWRERKTAIIILISWRALARVFSVFFFLYLEYYVGKNTMAANILPDTINPDLDIGDVIVVHNFRFQVGLLTWLLNIFLDERIELKSLQQGRGPYR